MFSIICVFNDKEVLNNCLLNSLKNQTVDHQIITVDNRSGTFENAATALNHGAQQAKGEWVLFVHQDVVFLSSDWLSEAEHMLNALNSFGWVGVAGKDESGETRAFLRDSAKLTGLPFKGAQEVQTLDELLLIHRREVSGSTYFDNNVPGWHAYGVEACCAAIRAGKKNYVLPLLVWHDSLRTNMKGLIQSHDYVWQKHGVAFDHIYTTCGDLSVNDDNLGRNSLTLLWRIRRRLCILGFYKYGFRNTSLSWFEEELEKITQNASHVEVLYNKAAQKPIEVQAFVQQPTRKRRIVCRFSNFEDLNWDADCLIIAPCLSSKMASYLTILEDMQLRARNILICFRMHDIQSQPSLWHKLRQKADKLILTIEEDGTFIAVLRIRKPEDLCSSI